LLEKYGEEGVEAIQLAPGKVQFRAVVDREINLQFL
jgi:hypothetical protein